METKERVLQQLKILIRWLVRYWDQLLTAWLMVCLLCGGFWYVHRQIDSQEWNTRHKIIDTAESYLGCKEADGSHQAIIDRYNAYEPSPRNYKVTYEDNWCATFGSVAALDAGMEAIIPMECSCEQQINLFIDMGRWREDECYLPRSGDYIYYVWDEWRSGDCTAWASHVGIVAETFGPVIKVIEGNKDDAVDYRYIFLNDITIRGYGLPDYQKLAGSN